MAITKNEVLYVAKLARISMEESELEKFTSQLDSILDYMNKLNEIDTNDIKPTSHILNLNNVVRSDKVKKSLGTEEVVELAPEKEGDFIKVPKVIE